MKEKFDPAKDAKNQAKHGLPLEFGDRIFDDPAHVVVETIRPHDLERRFKVVGLVGSKLFTGVFVWRGGQPRFISVRRSNVGEERPYRDPR